MFNPLAKVKCPYEFEMCSPTQYNLLITVPIKGELFENIYKRVKGALALKAARLMDGMPANLEVCDGFNTPPEYFPTIRTALDGNLKQIKKEVASDKIKILSAEIQKAEYRKVRGDWYMLAVIGGDAFDGRN